MLIPFKHALLLLLVMVVVVVVVCKVQTQNRPTYSQVPISIHSLGQEFIMQSNCSTNSQMSLDSSSSMYPPLLNGLPRFCL